jgi:hypothetical protein
MEDQKPQETQEAPKEEVTKVEVPKTEAPKVDATQVVETKAYVPTYRLKPEFKAAVLKAIGTYPFNQIAGIMNAIQVDVVDHNTFQQIVNVLGNFPYQQVAGILQNINSYVEQIVED